jgi:hypothetical protein
MVFDCTCTCTCTCTSRLLPVPVHPGYYRYLPYIVHVPHNVLPVVSYQVLVPGSIDPTQLLHSIHPGYRQNELKYIRAPSSGLWINPVQAQVCAVHCILYIVHCILYIVYCTLYIVHCTLYIVHCTLYIVHCTLYIVHCTLYIHLQSTAHCTYIYHLQPTTNNLQKSTIYLHVIHLPSTV